MKRRSVLTLLGVAPIGFGGCLGEYQLGNEHTKDTGANRNTYKPCNKKILNFGLLPDEVKTEVKETFDEGKYRTEDGLLYEQVEGPEVQALLRDGRYYESEITEDQDGYQTLSFTETTVTHEEKKDLLIQNITTKAWNGTVTVEDSNGDRLLQKEVTVESFPDDEIPNESDHIDDRITQIPLTDEYGSYTLTFEPKSGKSIQLEDTIGRVDRVGILVVIDDEEIRSNDEYLPGGVRFAEGDERTVCRWDEKDSK